MKKLTLILLTIAISYVSVSQQHSLTPKSDTVSFHKGHQRSYVHEVSLLYGSIMMPEYGHEGIKVGYAFLPSVSIDYDIWFHEKFGILLMNEFVLNSYELKAANGDFFQRESIMINAIGFGFRPIRSLDVYAGGGWETDLSNGVSFNIFRAGLEYAIPIRKNWATVLALAGDFRQNYSSVSFEIGFAKFW
jgi:hypothetical protein